MTGEQTSIKFMGRIMKNHLTVLIFVIIISGFNRPCSGNPLSGIISLFQRDLVINVLYTNHQNLIQGSEVYLAEDLQKQKVLIGRVKKVSLIESNLSKVEIIIDKKYKEQIYETTPFVLMGNPFSENSTAYILAISSLQSGKTSLESGSSVKGITFLDYKIVIAGEKLKELMDSIKKQNNVLLSQLEQYIDTLNTEAFQKKIDELVNQISKFSAGQKETFKNEVLPSLRKMFDSIKEQLEKQNNMEKSEDMENQLKEIEDMVDV